MPACPLATKPHRSRGTTWFVSRAENKCFFTPAESFAGSVGQYHVAPRSTRNLFRINRQPTFPRTCKNSPLQRNQPPTLRHYRSNFRYIMSAKVFVLLVVLLSVATVCLHAAPQAEKYEAYEYKYEVKDPEKQLFFDKNEAGDTAGKVRDYPTGTGKRNMYIFTLFRFVQVTGRYSVWLPDGRLMTIKYVVDKEGGFQPEVDFQDNANPLSG
uniref:Uncharacterized protein n=1 Tax=Anopheles atroparvus TaxID=41427 RepID=A0A182JAN2_ANOAO